MADLPGVFGFMLEPFLTDDCMSDDRLAALSACLGSLVCVDFSRSESEPDAIAWFKGARVGKVVLIEMEDADGEPYHLSPQIEALIANEVRAPGIATGGSGHGRPAARSAEST